MHKHLSCSSAVTENHSRNSENILALEPLQQDLIGGDLLAQASAQAFCDLVHGESDAFAGSCDLRVGGCTGGQNRCEASIRRCNDLMLVVELDERGQVGS